MKHNGLREVPNQPQAVVPVFDASIENPSIQAHVPAVFGAVF